MSLEDSQSRCPFDFLVALHVQTTCDDHPSNTSQEVKVPRDKAEVVDLSFTVVQISPRLILHQQQVIVKPEHTSLGTFAASRSGLTQTQLDEAEPLKEALQTVNEFVQTHFISQDKTFCFVTHGDWDLRYQIVREAKEKSIELAPYFSVYFDLVNEVNIWSTVCEGGARLSAAKTSLTGLCSVVDIQPESRGQSSPEEAMTIARIIDAVLGHANEWIASLPVPPSTDVVLPFEKPTNLAREMADFHGSQSRVLHLGGLPFRATASEVGSWIGTVGVHAADLWMVKDAEGRPDGTGFAIFENHDDAVTALKLDGRVLGSQKVFVRPSSDKAFQNAGSRRAPFPDVDSVAPNAATAPRATEGAPAGLKPGDWVCSACNYHNFASRRSCFKCYAPSTNASLSPGPGAGSGGPPGDSGYYNSPAGDRGGYPGGLKPGDWYCPNSNCKFQNFASRTECMRCRSPRPGYQGPPGGRQGGVSHKILPGDWICQQCNLNNFASRRNCMQCGGPNTGILAKPNAVASRSRPTDRPGDWSCPNIHCRYHNYASRQECYRCQTRRPEGAGLSYGGGGSHMPMKSGDWTCPNTACRYHNFAKRDTCAVCGTHVSSSGAGAGMGVGVGVGVGVGYGATAGPRVGAGPAQGYYGYAGAQSTMGSSGYDSTSYQGVSGYGGQYGGYDYRPTYNPAGGYASQYPPQ
ncbi:uncharacterized protein BJ171DRAFT_516334 [Polychytrium aggregatum]|uniref:uncharacterized protein n=1 Tax=Polychytrium aggregatum TaxID=110093 RepID=UPI0022FF1D89|nr:uncharacterized protein BJ171DRAFT_516334 [Polychytrium aggregatum]KAI9202022.1 hypothetical protein BJ171DRAFT_516334 [Polychytrium aggregatum]